MSTSLHAADGSDESKARAPSGPLNLGDTERVLSVLGGVAIALCGVRRGTLGGLGVSAVGGAIAYRGIRGYCPLYKKLGITSAKPVSPEAYHDHGIRAEFAVTIDKSAAELYAFWRELETLPSFMTHLKSVKRLGEKTSRWIARGPAGTSVQWDAEIINDVPNQTLAWRSIAGAQVDNTGSVRFIEAPAGRGTEVHIVLEYIPPGRVLGKWVARLFGEDPQLQIEADLRRFKQLMECGETSTIDCQPRGDCKA